MRPFGYSRSNIFCWGAVATALLAASCGTPSPEPVVSNAPQSTTQTIDTSATVKVVPQPVGTGDTAWVNIASLDADILIDMRYATTNNFVKAKMYDCGQCYLRDRVAKALLRAEAELKQKGMHFKMFDCYRPKPYQQRLWDKVPDARYVTPPAKGSMHGRGAAVDLTIVDAQGNELDMGTPFDFFGEEAYHDYTQHSPTVRENRALLLGLMEKHGFEPTRTEWWHYSYPKGTYPLSSWLWPCE